MTLRCFVGVGGSGSGIQWVGFNEAVSVWSRALGMRKVAGDCEERDVRESLREVADQTRLMTTSGLTANGQHDRFRLAS